MKHVWVYLIVGCAVGTAPLNADEIPWNAPRPRGPIVVEHRTTQAGGPASDTLFLDPFGQPAWQRLADEVILTAPATIRRLTWCGFYNLNNALSTETMRIRFYAGRPGDGLPDENNILFERSYLNPSRLATGRRIGVGIGPDEYKYEINLAMPIQLGASTPVRCGLRC